MYRVIEKSAGRELACKMSRREDSRWPWNHVLDLYEREAKLLRHVQGHPNVIQYAGLYKEPSRIYMVMELVKGSDLHTVLTKQRCLQEEAARAAFTQLVSAIDHLHANGVLHRDIKLENVLYDQTAQPAVIKVCDLGNSMLVNQPPAGNFKGTNGYTAPEVSNGAVASWSAKADVWALGVVLYAMLGGYLPFDDARGRHSSTQYLDFSNAAWWDISVEAKLLIQAMLTPSVADRATLDDVIDSPWLARVDPSRLPTPVAPPLLHPVASMPVIADVITRYAAARSPGHRTPHASAAHASAACWPRAHVRRSRGARAPLRSLSLRSYRKPSANNIGAGSAAAARIEEDEETCAALGASAPRPGGGGGGGGGGMFGMGSGMSRSRGSASCSNLAGMASSAGHGGRASGLANGRAFAPVAQTPMTVAAGASASEDASASAAVSASGWQQQSDSKDQTLSDLISRCKQQGMKMSISVARGIANKPMQQQ